MLPRGCFLIAGGRSLMIHPQMWVSFVDHVVDTAYTGQNPGSPPQSEQVQQRMWGTCCRSAASCLAGPSSLLLDFKQLLKKSHAGCQAPPTATHDSCYQCARELEQMWHALQLLPVYSTARDAVLMLRHCVGSLAQPLHWTAPVTMGCQPQLDLSLSPRTCHQQTSGMLGRQ